MRYPIKNYFDNNMVFIVVLISICIVFSFISIIYILYLQINQLQLTAESLLHTQELLLKTQKALLLDIYEKEAHIQKLISLMGKEIPAQAVLENNEVLSNKDNSLFQIFPKICFVTMLVVYVYFRVRFG